MKEDYPLYVKWSEAADWILDAVEKFPKSVRFTISGRVANLALDIVEGIVEAIYAKERRPVLDKINLDLEKLRVLFGICHRRKYISVRQYEHVSRLMDDTGRMVGGWRRQD
ncbi:MAG: diversity-generating retroelement protein Avd [Proteobacteria bacterium]|nr:diversity-generating retroelement protein Avd [Pseudomonadota bacterium]